MDQFNIDLYLSRILSGYYIFTYKKDKYKLIYPNINVKYLAELYIENEYEKNKFNNWIQEEEIIHSLISLGLWTFNGDENLKNIENQIEDIKVDLYKSHYNTTKLKSLRRQLSNTKNRYNYQYNTRHSFDQYTLKGYLDLLKNQYILAYSIYNLNDNLIFTDIETIDYNSFNSISNIIYQNTIDTSMYRKIARSNLWNNYWSSNNSHLFNSAVINWTDEQKMLVMFTKMYENAREHSECPPDIVFEDDDLFDGWMISQRRENEKQKNKNRASKLLDNKNLKNANEVFLVADSQEEAQNVYDLNDPTSRHIIKERTSLINNNNQIQEQNLPDVQRQLVMQRNQQSMGARKK
jgi:hypothetical protein